LSSFDLSSSFSVGIGSSLTIAASTVPLAHVPSIVLGCFLSSKSSGVPFAEISNPAMLSSIWTKAAGFLALATSPAATLGIIGLSYLAGA